MRRKSAVVAKGKRTVPDEETPRERTKKDMSDAKKSQKKRITSSRRRTGPSEQLEVIDSFESWLERQPVRAAKAKAGYSGAEGREQADESDDDGGRT